MCKPFFGSRGRWAGSWVKAMQFGFTMALRKLILTYEMDDSACEAALKKEKEENTMGIKTNWNLFEFSTLASHLVVTGPMKRGDPGCKAVFAELFELRPGRPYSPELCASVMRRLVAKFNRVTALMSSGYGDHQETELGLAVKITLMLKSKKKRKACRLN